MPLATKDFPKGRQGRNMNNDSHRPTEPSSAASQIASPAVARIDARQQHGSSREVILTLQGSEYRLRLTSKGKLILTK
jgi:hemin uptake protein HemP